MTSNARSIIAKVPSLLERFENYELDFALVNETWLTSGANLDMQSDDLELGANIGMVTKNRKKRMGGGVAVFFSKERMPMKQVRIRNNTFEMVSAVGDFARSGRKILAVSVYCPPEMTAANYKKN